MTPHPPHLYTTAEWDGMSEADRRMVRAHRRRAVEWARDEHERRYAAAEERRRELWLWPDAR